MCKKRIWGEVMACPNCGHTEEHNRVLKDGYSSIIKNKCCSKRMDWFNVIDDDYYSCLNGFCPCDCEDKDFLDSRKRDIDFVKDKRKEPNSRVDEYG